MKGTEEKDLKEPWSSIQRSLAGKLGTKSVTKTTFQKNTILGFSWSSRCWRNSKTELMLAKMSMIL